ncbi:MAG: flagellin [Candidatus Melainabacteria bacterium]|nr:flagellin [Candidatus Melainabacteria bacterium]
MSIVVNTNVSSLNAQRYLSFNTSALGKSQEKLASGFRINRASDDAAGLQISETLRAQIRGSQKALDNVQDGINVLNIVDGAFNQITENMQRMRELVVQGANDTLATAQRDAIEEELDQLAADIDRIANGTQFNGVNLLTGSTTSFRIQVGPNSTSTTNMINIATAANTNPLATATASALGVDDASISVASNASALQTLSGIDGALSTLNTRRATAGALTNRLQGAANNLAIGIENLSASESRIRNVDVAKESAELVRNQILQQASATILSQANQSPQLALSLLRG